MVSEGLCVLSVQSTSSGKHDGGVEVCNDSRHSAGCCDAGLGAAVTCLQGCQHMGDLQEEDQSVVNGRWTVHILQSEISIRLM